jgi:PEP-CTERM motif
MGKVRFSWGSFAAGLDRGRLAAIAVLLVEAAVVSSLVAPAKARPATLLVSQASSFALETPSSPFESNGSNPTPARNFYPYSVIPGGADSASELRSAIANDSTVRAHYADFMVASARVERLKAPQAFYVSYRVGNTIFWTKSALTIPAGETILSDGNHLARTRCGNRLSAVPAAPVAPIEVAPAAMESPAGEPLVAAVGPIAAPAELPVAPVILTEVASAPPTPAVSTPSGGVLLFLPPYIPVGLGGGSTPGTPTSPGAPGTPPGGGPSGTSPGTPPVQAPEPSALLMLGVGFAGILLWSKLR